MLSSTNLTNNALFASQVRSSEELIPQQCQTSFDFKRACDFREYNTLKHPGLSEFHSLAEYLHSGLLEGDPTVELYVPQPFRLQIKGRRYTPDCYVLQNGRRKVIEIKPNGEFDEDRKGALEAYFSLNNMDFEVLSNEAILARTVEAENWIEIVHCLHMARAIDTQHAEIEVLDRFWQQENAQCTLDCFIDLGDRERSFDKEIALFRLLHRGLLTAALSDSPLDYTTVIQRCA